MITQENVKLLKMLVISMGLVLMGGAIFVGTVVVKKLSHANVVNDCAGGHLDLTGRGIIVESHTDDQIMRMTLEKQPGKNEILTIDTCTGQILGTLTIQTDPGMAEE